MNKSGNKVQSNSQSQPTLSNQIEKIKSEMEKEKVETLLVYNFIYLTLISLFIGASLSAFKVKSNYSLSVASGSIGASVIFYLYAFCSAIFSIRRHKLLKHQYDTLYDTLSSKETLNENTEKMVNNFLCNFAPKNKLNSVNKEQNTYIFYMGAFLALIYLLYAIPCYIILVKKHGLIKNLNTLESALLIAYSILILTSFITTVTCAIHTYTTTSAVEKLSDANCKIKNLLIKFEKNGSDSSKPDNGNTTPHYYYGACPIQPPSYYVACSNQPQPSSYDDPPSYYDVACSTQSPGRCNLEITSTHDMSPPPPYNDNDCTASTTSKQRLFFCEESYTAQPDRYTDHIQTL